MEVRAMRKALGVALVAVVLAVSSVPAAAQWVHSDWQWKCAGSQSMNQHRYWVTQGDRPDSARIKAKRITVVVNVSGDQRTTVCENQDSCEWTQETPGGLCQKSCSRAAVIFPDDRTLNTDEQCAR
jgi:hypothetical protein